MLTCVDGWARINRQKKKEKLFVEKLTVNKENEELFGTHPNWFLFLTGQSESSNLQRRRI